MTAPHSRFAWEYPLTNPKPSDAQADTLGAKPLNFYITPAHPCGYLPGRAATSLIADLRVRVDTRLYSLLINYGFRRSGEIIYRPQCQHCNACVPVRIPAADFKPRRNQRRIWQRNQDLRVERVPVAFQDDHFRLYQRYIASRHSGGGMDHVNPEHYIEFIKSAGIDAGLYEFRLDGQLLAVAVTDHLTQGWSAVYTFFDPEQAARGLGTFAILWQIDQVRRQGLTWLYLGYWIKECRKMSYKDQYMPMEIYRDNVWLRIDT